MLLALVEQEGLQDVGRYGVTGQVQVLFVRTGFQDSLLIRCLWLLVESMAG